MSDDQRIPDIRVSEFFEKALAAGVPHQSVVGLLTAQGWHEKDVYRALGTHIRNTLGVDVPPPLRLGSFRQGRVLLPAHLCHARHLDRQPRLARLSTHRPLASRPALLELHADLRELRDHLGAGRDPHRLPALPAYLPRCPPRRRRRSRKTRLRHPQVAHLLWPWSSPLPSSWAT